MIHSTNKRKLMALLNTLLFIANSPLQACMTTFFNDGAGTALLLDHNNPQNKNNPAMPASLIFIPKNTSRRFGSAHEKSNFTIYTRQLKSQEFNPVYQAVQNECGKNGNPFIKFSDLKNKTGQTSLFTITQINTPRSSMVRELPSMQRADIYRQEQEEPAEHCSVCSMTK